MKLGIIGLDSSHATAFTELLHNKEHPYYIEGATIIGAYAGGSDDLAISRNRIKEMTETMEKTYHVPLFKQLDDLMQVCDAVLITSVDARKRLATLREIIHYGKPIFIDKPLALTFDDAKEINNLSCKYGTAIMTSSALRFATALTAVMEANKDEKIISVDCYGPLDFVDGIPGYFWYGIHTVEMLQTIMKKKGNVINRLQTEGSEIVTVTYEGGMTATIRGLKTGMASFGGTVFFENKSVTFQVKSEDKPFYASLLESIVTFFQTGRSEVTMEESLQVIHLIEQVHQSKPK